MKLVIDTVPCCLCNVIHFAQAMPTEERCHMRDHLLCHPIKYVCFGAIVVPAKPTWVSPCDSCQPAAMTNRCLLLQFGFWRVVLDEAQLVAATSSVAAQMTSSLWRRHAWVVTGTPITARLEEIQVTDMQHHSSINVDPVYYAWVVTGTPITARLEEIQVRDMQHRPFINKVHPMRYAWVVKGTPITALLEEIQVRGMQHCPIINTAHPMR